MPGNRSTSAATPLTVLALAASCGDEPRAPRVGGEVSVDDPSRLAGDAGVAAERGAGSGPGGLSEQEFLARFREGVCQTYRGCCAPFGYEPSSIDCSLWDRTPPPSTTFDPSAAEQCLAELEALDGSCGSDALDEPCSRVHRGLRAPGESCLADDECAPVPNAEVWCLDTCTFRRPAAEGEPCNVSCREWNDAVTCQFGGSPELLGHEQAECRLEDGLVCGLDGVCARVPDRGEPCTFTCAGGDLCLYDEDGGRCGPAPGEGEPCADPSGECALGLYCDGSSLCQPRGAEGRPCDPAVLRACLGNCQPNGLCGPEPSPLTLEEACALVAR